MNDLRAEDVKEALAQHESWRKLIERRYPDAFDLVDGNALAIQATLAAAARAWLTPNYEAAHRVLVERGIRTAGTVDSGLAHVIVDAALGVHPVQSPEVPT